MPWPPLALWVWQASPRMNTRGRALGLCSVAASSIGESVTDLVDAEPGHVFDVEVVRVQDVVGFGNGDVCRCAANAAGAVGNLAEVDVEPEEEAAFEDILDAATRVMGYAATSLSALATEIGLAKSVILHHFHTKGGLLSAVVERGMNDFFDAMSRGHANAPSSGTSQELLTWFLKRAAAVLTEREEFLRLHMFIILGEETDVAEAEVRESVAKVRRDGRRHVHHMLRESFRDHGPEIAEQVAGRFERFGMAGIDGAFLGGQAEPERSMSDEMEQLAEAMALMGDRFADSLAHRA